MQRVTVLYPYGADVKFDFDYYLAKHVPWVAGLLVGQSIEVRRDSLPRPARLLRSFASPPYTFRP
jgi:hypothetical protein